MQIELNKEYPLNGFVMPDLRRARVTEIYIPTETVVYEPRFVTPKIARVYELSYWFVNNEILDYEGLVRISEAPFKGTSYYNNFQILLVEVWDDDGSDGHTNYRHVGFRYVTRAQYISDKNNLISLNTIPDCMLAQHLY